MRRKGEDEVEGLSTDRTTVSAAKEALPNSCHIQANSCHIKMTRNPSWR